MANFQSDRGGDRKYERSDRRQIPTLDFMERQDAVDKNWLVQHVPGQIE